MRWLDDTAFGRSLKRLRRASKEQSRSERNKAQLLAHLGIDLVIDVGANRGQYGDHLRSIGYRGPIVSFEPVTEAYGHLVKAAAADGNWITRQLALGARRGRLPLHIAGNIGMSSSFLEMLPSHVAAEPSSAYVGQEDVEIVPLDDIFDELRGQAQHVFLKLDVQGTEAAILDGGAATLARLDLLELESSVVPLYQGECLFPAMMTRLEAVGFVMVGLSHNFDDPRTGQLLQVDALYARRDRFPSRPRGWSGITAGQVALQRCRRRLDRQ